MNSIRAWWYLHQEAFLILRRDRIFVPVIVMGVAIALFASIASAWTIEDYEKMLFDIGVAGFRLTGCVVAMLWGVRMITDPLQDRSIELRIASPAARFIWLLSRFTGLSACLLLMGGSFILIWQLVMSLNNFGSMSNLQGWTLGLLILEWISLGALGILLGTLAGFSTALFATLGVWVMGLIAPLVAATLSENVPPLQRQLIEWLATTWNFQRFNLSDQLDQGAHTVVLADLLLRLTWGLSMVLGCLVLSSWVFQKKDLT